MLVQRKEKQIKEVEVTLDYHYLCDKCNQKIIEEAYDAFKFEFILKAGSAYPEGGDGTVDEMHLCKNCAEELVKNLKESGYRINQSEWCY